MEKDSFNFISENRNEKENENIQPFIQTTLNDFIEEQLQDPVFKEKYDALEPEFTVMQALIDARKEKGMTQKELAEITGISQADISKIGE